MTESYFFDTDCISAFLWVRNESILTKLYPGKIVLPKQVYDEISKVPPLLKRIEIMKNNGELSVKSIDYARRYPLKLHHIQLRSCHQ